MKKLLPSRSFASEERRHNKVIKKRGGAVVYLRIVTRRLIRIYINKSYSLPC